MKINYEVTSDDFSKAGEASSDFKKTMKKLGIESIIVRKVAIAMYEAEINMIIHGDGGIIEAEILPNKIKVLLKDSGKGIPDIELAKTEGFSTATEEIRELGFGAGMGIPNMIRNSDYFNIESEVGVGTLVEIVVDLD